MSRAPIGPTVAERRRRRGVWAGAIAVSLMASILAAWLALRPRPSEPLAPSRPTASNTSAISSALAQPDLASVAVLPFANLSGDPDNEYFADGLAEELLNALTKVRGLRVIARTSSFQFKGKNEDVRVIGQKLSVGAILEGSVRKSRDRVRIAAQLLNAADGFHLWSETYDRKLDDIFAVQDEISRAVVGALKITLLPNVGATPHQSTKDIEAHDAYLLGRSHMKTNNEDDLVIALRQLERSVALDPAFAPAWVGLAEAYWMQGDVDVVPMQDALRRARGALDRAFALHENLPEALVLAATLGILEDWDFSRADQEVQRAAVLAPGNAGVLVGAARFAAAVGRLDEASTLARRAIRLDPLNQFGYSLYVGTLLAAGRQGEAESAMKAALATDPTFEGNGARLGAWSLLHGRPEDALTEFNRMPVSMLRSMLSACAFHALGRGAESDEALKELVERYGRVAAYQIAQVYAFRGEAGQAVAWLKRAKVQRDMGLIDVGWDLWLENIRRDPRYRMFLEKLHLTQ